jgi:hypothetical protein
MSERPSFLPPADFQRVAPEPEGFTAALGSAQRRRRRQLGEAGVALGLAVALLAGINMPTRETGQDRVGVTDEAPSRPDLENDPTSDDDDTVVALPHSSDEPAAGTAGGTATVRTGSGTGTGVGTVTSPGGQAAQPKVPDRRPRAPRGPSYADGLAYKRPTVRTAGALAGTCVQQMWCVTPQVTAVDTDVFELSVEVCRAIDAPAVWVDFDSKRQVEFSVHNDKQSFWTWSLGQAFADEPESLSFAAGTCYIWTTPYSNPVDDFGRLLDKGRYTVTSFSYGSGLGPSHSGTTQFDVVGEASM